MDAQSKFVPPELLYLVLEYLKVHEQFNVRRVNKKFKDVVENSVWPSRKVLDFKYLNKKHRYRIHYRHWELMLSHMPKLEKIQEDSYGERKLSRIVTLLPKYCPAIQRFSTNSEWHIEYLTELSKRGVYETSMMLFTQFDKSGKREEKLDAIDPKSTYKIDLYSYFHDIPEKYLDRIYSIYNLEASQPYLPNLKIVAESYDWDKSEFMSKYYQQLTIITSFSLAHASQLHNFVNLENLKVVFDDYATKEDQELEHVTALERYLESNISCHINSLRVYLIHKKNCDRLTETLSSLDRPRKWKRLIVEHMNYDPSGINFEKRQLTILSAWTNHPVTWINNLIERMTSPTVIKFAYYNEDIKISQMEFDNWKLWLENYASKHRNKNIELRILPEEEFGIEKHTVEKDNWSIVHQPHLISDT